MQWWFNLCAGMIQSPQAAFRFGPFRLQAPARILERDGQRIPLTPKVVDTLLILLENRGQVVTKEALMKAVWPDVNVVESGLTRNISVLRKALEEGTEEGAFIETIPRRGYRFVAEVTQEEAFEPPRPEQPSTAPEPVDPAAPAPRRNPVWRRVGAGCAGVAGLLVCGVLAIDAGSAPARAVEPSVRIGEHLLYKMSPAEAVKSVSYFEQAVARSPKSAEARAGLSLGSLQLTLLGVRSPAEMNGSATQYAREAMKLDPGSAAANLAMGMIDLHVHWDFPAAEARFRRALEIDPGSVEARFGYARLQLVAGRTNEAQSLIEEALRLDPASPPLGVDYCRMFYYRRDFHRAEAECRKVLHREPGYALAHYYLALSLGMLGRMEEADLALQDSGLMPGVIEADRAWLRLLAGDRRPALAALTARRELIRRGAIDATSKLLLASVLERRDEAFEAIEAGIATRASEILTLHLDVRLDAIRQDPRYPDVLRRIGLGTIESQ